MGRAKPRFHLPVPNVFNTQHHSYPLKYGYFNPLFRGLPVNFQMVSFVIVSVSMYYMHLKYAFLPGICLFLVALVALSVRSVAQASGKDTSALMALIVEAQQIESTDPEKAKAMYLQMREKSEAIGWKTGLLKFYTNYTAVLNQQSRFDSSLALNLESIELANQVGDPHYIMATQLNTGLSYSYLNDSETALRYFTLALPLAEKSNNETVQSILHENLGNTYLAIKNRDAARHHLYKALELSKKAKDTTGMCYSYNNLAKLHTELKEFDTAMNRVKEGIKLNSSLGSKYLEMIFHLNLTNIFMQQGQYPNMYLPAHQALSLAGELNDLSGTANACYALGWLLLFEKRLDSVNFFVKKGWESASLSGSKKEKMEMLDLGAQAALAAGNMTLFDSLLKRSNALGDSILNEGIQRSTLTVMAKFETEKRLERIGQLEKDALLKKRWNYLLGAALFLLGVLAIMGYGNYKQKQKLATQQEALQTARIEELEKEKQLLATQSLLRGQEEERTRLARELHDGVGGMLSGIKLTLGAMKGNVWLAEQDARLFGSALNKLDETISEMRRVAHSMMPEALLRLGLGAAVADYCEGLQATGRLAVQYTQFGMENRLPADMEIVVYRVVQELFTNVLKHAEASHVLVQLMRHDDRLSLTFEDDGKGMDELLLEKIKGAGLQNINTRVSYLKGQIDLRSAPGKGTSFHIEIPIEAA
jgi:signal transduction histidine kinase